MKRFSQYALGVVFIVSLVACGKGQNEVKGKLGGKELSPKASVSTAGQNGSLFTLAIGLSDNEALCDESKANKQKAGERDLVFSVVGAEAIKAGKFSLGGSLPSDSDGNFTAPTAPVAMAFYGQLDNACKASPEEAASGTLTLTKVDKDGAEGSFDVTFTNGDKVSGSFTAENCSIPQTDAETTCTK